MTAHLTKPVYYYDDNGYKIGPVRKRDIITLAENGTIKPETRITDDKIEVRAKQIPNLKFCAPEYHRAEEMFNPENIDFDNTPLPINPEPIIRQTREANANPREHAPNPNPFVQNNWSGNQEATPRKANYWYFNLVVKLFYPIATIIFYGGLTLTAVTTLVCLVIATFEPRILLFALPVLFGGATITLFYTMFFGLIADHIQWEINIEEYLKEIKNRSSQND